MKQVSDFHVFFSPYFACFFYPSKPQKICKRKCKLFIYVGSYDEWLRKWDERNLKREVESVQVGGGVWRIKQRHEKLLVAAMHGGYLVLNNMDIVARFVQTVYLNNLNIVVQILGQK